MAAISCILEMDLMRYKELLQTGEHVSTLARAKGRRRSGRSDQVNPHLIPLLRNPATMDIPTLLPGEADTSSLEDDLAAVKGTTFALALSVPFWVGIAGIVWAVLR